MEIKFLESVRLQTMVVCLHEISCPELPHPQLYITHTHTDTVWGNAVRNLQHGIDHLSAVNSVR